MKGHRIKLSRIIRINVRSGLITDRNRVSPIDGYFSNESATQAINDYHRRSKTRKFSRRNQFFKLFLCILTLILIAVLIIVIVLLIRSPVKKSQIAILRWNSSGITIAGDGTSGIASNQLNRPWDLVLNWNRTFYVTDRFNNRVQKFFRDSTDGITVAGQISGVAGSTLSDLKEPTGIDIDSDENLYVSDKENHRVLFWPKNSATGNIAGGTGTVGDQNNELNLPYTISGDWISKSLYISDNANHRIMRYELNGAIVGTLIAGGNGPGSNTNQFNLAISFYRDPLTNSILVVNELQHSIVRCPIGINNWTLVLGNSNGLPGNSSSEFRQPSDVMLDPMGNIYVCDRFNHRIQFFFLSQTTGSTILGLSNISGNNSTLLNGPTSFQLDNQLNLYVVDQNNHRIQQFLRY